MARNQGGLYAALPEKAIQAHSYGQVGGMDLDAQQVTYILQLEYLPCEICLKLYCADAYDTVEKGVELDHIEPVNPEDALDRKYFLHISEGYGGRTSVEFPTYGDPFSFDNLQLLCRFHHAKKSQRERRKK
jgi:hypothetical protein